MVLDQGYWPESGLTAPDDQALRRDVELAKRDGVQWRAQASEDRGPALSVLGGHAGPRGVGRDAERVPVHSAVGEAPYAANGRRSSNATTAIHASRPGCRSTNRGGSRICRRIPRERHYVEALYHLTKTLDPTRPVIGNDGWESVATDHHRHSRLRRPARANREAVPRRRSASAPVQARASRRPAPGARGTAAGRSAADADRVRRHRAELASEPGTWGYSVVGDRGRIRARSTSDCWRLSASSDLLAGLLLHAVHRHLSGGERPALRRSHAEDSPSSASPRRPPAGAARRAATDSSRFNCTPMPTRSGDVQAGARQA